MKIFIIGSMVPKSETYAAFLTYFEMLGRQLAGHRITIALCSPYPSSCDMTVLTGLTASADIIASVEIHYPATSDIEQAWTEALKAIGSKIKVDKFRHEGPQQTGKQPLTYSWLFCQLQAMAGSNRILIAGGNLDGSSNLLTRIAEAQGKELVPLAAFGGVGERYFDRKRYELQDKWGLPAVESLFQANNPKLIAELIAAELPRKEQNTTAGEERPVFFISYARENPADADFIEMLLRRRNYIVLRDDNVIAAGEEITPALKEIIHRSTVFIAVYSRAYACSPWCYDELEIGLSTLGSLRKSLWLLRTEPVRVVHPRARTINYFDVFSRAELEGRILKLLETV